MTTQTEALKLALETLEDRGELSANEFKEKKNDAITAIKEALANHTENNLAMVAQPEQEEKLHPVHIGVDVTKEGTAVTAFYRKPNAVMEMFYSQFHPLAQPEQEPVAYGMWDTMIGYGGRMMLVRLDKGQDGCTVPLYTTPPQRKPLTHEQRFDLLTKFEPHKNKWEAPAILIDIVEAAHGIKE